MHGVETPLSNPMVNNSEMVRDRSVNRPLARNRTLAFKSNHFLCYGRLCSGQINFSQQLENGKR
jgi:hypothetical protein